MMMILAAAAIGPLSLPRAGLVSPQQQPPERRVARVTRIEPSEAPEIDGNITEAVWAKVAEIGELHQRVPALGAAPSERTKIQIAQDGKNLYIAIYCYDSSPDELRATQIRRDSDLEPDDRVEIVLDTLHDRRNSYFFQISPGGSIGDALISGNGANFNKPWDGIWRGKSKITKDGWCAELEIPFRTVATLESVSTWGFNLARHVRRKNEECVWNDPSLDHTIFRISENGDLEGLDRIEQGIGLDLVPYTRASWTNFQQKENTNIEGTAGGELFYRFTPGLTGAITTNTDFAETEVDDRRVNLTRFPLFFPEKRKFFLEDAGVFNFETGGGRGSSDLLPFFSRRIGLGPSGTIPLRTGAKLSGYAGPWSVGALAVEMGRDNQIESQTLGAARVRNNISKHSTVGGIVTGGDPTGQSDNQLLGVDYKYTRNDLGESRNFDFTAFFLKSFTPDENGNDRAMGAEISLPNDLWRIRARAREIGDDFDPKLGFVPRRGIRVYDGEVTYGPRLNQDVRQLKFGVRPRVTTDLGGRTEDAFVPLSAEVLFESGEYIRFAVTPSNEHIDQNFAVVPGLIIPAGHYNQIDQSLQFMSSQKRVLALDLSERTGGFDGGHVYELNESVTWRPGGMLQTGLESTQTWLRMPGGEADVLIARWRTEVNFSPDVSWQTLAQLDNITKNAGVNSRLRWIVDPQKDFFFVVNQDWRETDSRAIVPVSSGIVAKFVITIRF